MRNEKRTWTLIATILASGIVFLDSSVVNVALPAIGRQLETGLSGLQWVIDGYILTLAAFLILGGALGDRYGRRKMMVIGLIGFAAASVSAALAPSVSWLIFSRLLQGLAGALLVPGSLAILRVIFSEPKRRGEAIGQWSGWAGITTVIGPLLGGWLVDSFSWRWVFLINLPIIAFTIWILLRYVPESQEEQTNARLDWLGASLAVTGLGGLAYGLIEGPVLGWGSTTIIVSLSGGALAILLIPFVEARVRNPMVPLGLFRYRNFTGANLTTLLVYFALYGANFFLVIFLQNVVDFTALEAGLALAPISLILLVFSPRMGALAANIGPRWLMTAGPMISATGLFLMTGLHPNSDYLTGVLPPVAIFGFGLATTVAPLTNTVISAAPEGRSGVAAAFNNVVSRVAGLLAVAGLGVVLTWTFQQALSRRTDELSLSAAERRTLQQVAENPTGASLPEGFPQQAEIAIDQAYTAAFHRTMQASAVAAVAGGLIAAAVIRNPPVEKEERTQQRAL